MLMVLRNESLVSYSKEMMMRKVKVDIPLVGKFRTWINYATLATYSFTLYPPSLDAFCGGYLSPADLVVMFLSEIL